LKEEALDRTVWRTGFGRGCEPVVRPLNEWVNQSFNKYFFPYRRRECYGTLYPRCAVQMYSLYQGTELPFTDLKLFPEILQIVIFKIKLDITPRLPDGPKKKEM
jgi:hypothetical protein